jgi:hypothetical protein
MKAMFVLSLRACACGFAIFIASEVIADIRFVDIDSTVTTPTGLTWAAAYPDLEDALAEARINANVTEIWVADTPGLPGDSDYAYLPSDQTNPDFARSKTFRIGANLNGIIIRGGFQGISRQGGPETSETQRNPWVYVTRLSGDLANDDDPEDFDTYGDNAHHVVTMLDVTEGTVIDGFEIADGHAFEYEPTFGHEIGIDVRAGGGLHLSYLENHHTVPGPLLRQITFKKNRAFASGGGLYTEFAPVSVRHCRFIENELYIPVQENVGLANFSGGGACFNGQALVANCEFLRNRLQLVNEQLSSRSGEGGGLFATDITMTNCRFRENVIYGLPDGSGGAGAFVASSQEETPLIANCSFVLNKVLTPGVVDPDPAGSAGGLLLGPAAVHDENFVLRDCTFSKNEAKFCGGLFLNAAVEACNAPSIPSKAVNCIFYYNTDASGLDTAAKQCAVSLDTEWNDPECLTAFPPQFFSNSIIQGVCDATYYLVGDCVRDQNPMFEFDEFLTLGSPAIDAGSLGCASASACDTNDETAKDFANVDENAATLITDMVPWDINRRPRKINNVVDLGAPEFIPCKEDLDGDGVITGGDLGLLLAAWGNCDFSKVCPHDLNWDQAVDGADLGLLLAKWDYECEGGSSSMMMGEGGSSGFGPDDLAALYAFESESEFAAWLASMDFDDMEAVLSGLIE